MVRGDARMLGYGLPSLARAGLVCLCVFCTAQAEETWPTSKEGLIFAFRDMDHEILALNQEGAPCTGYSLEARGLAHTDYAGRLLLHNGSYSAPDIGLGLLDKVKRANAVSVEFLLIPVGENDTVRRPIISLGSDPDGANLVIMQSTNKLNIGLRNNAASQPTWHVVHGLARNMPLHVVLTVGAGEIQVYEEGILLWHAKWEGHFADWTDCGLQLGGRLAQGSHWPGMIEGIALYDRVLSPEEVATSAAAYAKILDSRNPPTQTRVRARLVGKSEIPSLDELAPYREALVVFSYEVDKVIDGRFEGKTCYVAHWLILDAMTVPFKDTPLGTTLELRLQPFDCVKALETRYLSDTIVEDFGLPLFYDAGGRSLGLDIPVEWPKANLAQNSENGQASGIRVASGTDEERARRKARIEKELADLRLRVNTLGGYDAWRANLTGFRADLAKPLSTKENAIVGKDGYLFFKMGLSYLRTDSFVTPRPSDSVENGRTKLFDTVVTLSNGLRDIGVDLIFVPIPARAEVYPDKIVDSGPPNMPAAPQRAEFMEKLLEADVEVVDLYPLVASMRQNGNEPYFKDDSHWRPDAIIAAAQLLSERLSAYEVVAQAGMAPSKYDTKDIKHSFRGHIVKSLPESIQADFPSYTIDLRSVLASDGSPYAPDPESPILIIGDSYTWLFAPQHANIGAHLARRINMPVAEVMSEGGGANAPRVLKRMGSHELAKKRVIIWMMTSRWLTDTRWQPVSID